MTVKKAAFYKMNMRTYYPFVFLPIEPPRPPPAEIQTFFARRKHRFAYTPVSRSSHHLLAKKKKGFFSSFGSSASKASAGVLQQPGPVIYLEARLPEPRIMVPTRPIDLTLVVCSQTKLDVEVYMHSISVNLLTTTISRVDAYSQENTMTLAVSHMQQLKLATSQSTNPQPGIYEAEFDRRRFSGLYLPNTVPPSFKTCNIERTYALEIVAELSHGSTGPREVCINS